MGAAVWHPPQAGNPGVPDRDWILRVPARIGVLRLPAGPLGLSSGMSPEVADAFAAFSVIPRAIQTTIDEGRGMPESLTEAGPVKNLGAIPLIVLSRGLNQRLDWMMQQQLLAW